MRGMWRLNRNRAAEGASRHHALHRMQVGAGSARAKAGVSRGDPCTQWFMPGSFVAGGEEPNPLTPLTRKGEPRKMGRSTSRILSASSKIGNSSYESKKVG